MSHWQFLNEKLGSDIVSHCIQPFLLPLKGITPRQHFTHFVVRELNYFKNYWDIGVGNGFSYIRHKDFCKHFTQDGIEWSQKAKKFLIPRAYIGTREAHNKKIEMGIELRKYYRSKNDKLEN